MDVQTDISTLELTLICLTLITIAFAVIVRSMLKRRALTGPLVISAPLDERSPVLELSSRERLVLNKILQGKTNKQIAQDMFVEVSTVKTHINNLYKTLGVRSRKEVLNRYSDNVRQVSTPDSSPFPPSQT